MKKHKILDKPFLAYLLLAAFVILFETFFGLIDMYVLSMPLKAIGVENYSAGIFSALGTLLAASIFKNKMLKGEYTGFLCKENLLMGLALILPLTLAHVAGSVISIMEMGFGSLLYALLSCFAPGVGEEIIFRGCGVANFMRVRRKEKDILVILLFSSILFGGVHLTNIYSGGDTVACIVQSIYAAGIGLLFGAVYLRTGNLWPSIISHCVIDFAELLRADMTASEGLMTHMILGDYVTTIVGFVAGFAGLYMIRKSKRAEILKVWEKKFPAIEE